MIREGFFRGSPDTGGVPVVINRICTESIMAAYDCEGGEKVIFPVLSHKRHLPSSSLVLRWISGYAPLTSQSPFAGERR